MYKRIVLDCGVSFNLGTPLIALGVNAKIGTAPWNVAIYENQFNDNNVFEFICGGSLVSSNLVISGKNKRSYTL